MCLANENRWTTPMVRLADEHGIEIKGVPGIDFYVLIARERSVDDEEADDTQAKAWKPEDD